MGLFFFSEEDAKELMQQVSLEVAVRTLYTAHTGRFTHIVWTPTQCMFSLCS